MAKKRGPTLVFQLAPRKKRSRQGIKVDINLLGLGLSTTYFFIKFKLKTVEKLNHRSGKRRKSTSVLPVFTSGGLVGRKYSEKYS